MDVEIIPDLEARRRNRRGIAFTLLAFALYLPTVMLVQAVAARLLGREAAARYDGAAFLVGLAPLAAAMLWGTRHSLSYRCPRCGRKLSKVVPRGEAEPNLHYLCEDCRVAWDLGWGPASGGGVGG